VIDVSRRDATAQKSPVHAALYLLLFPQLIAGPIIRYRDIADQLARRVVSIDDFAYGVRRFVIGLAKKVLIANVVAGPADRIFSLPAAELSTAHAWLGIVCYTLQIYFDFSGYSDMAIGLGRMFGFRFPENFRWPYVATSVTAFWRRWHISLSTWFRDYLYIPLGGNRVSPARRYFNLVTVFFLCGLWHGASWNFVIWGLWHGTFLVVERLTAKSPIHHITNSPTSGVLSWPIWPHVYTLAIVMIGWVFFRAETLTGAVAFLHSLAGLTEAAPTPYSVGWYLTPELWLALAAGAIGSAPWVPALAARIDDGRGWSVPLLNTAALLALLVLSIMSMAARTYNPFIYFRF
jgi:alginate O-acetyltransferase complex protein AlgI